MHIAVVGSGYVGLVAAACLAEIGHDVICVDNDTAKVAALLRGECPIFEEHLPELLDKHRGKRLAFTTDLVDAVAKSTVIFIAVGTPSDKDGNADLSYVETVARAIGGGVNSYKVIVEKSTVPVYTCEWIRKVLQFEGIAPEMVDVTSNPEFLREGAAVTDFLYGDRIVIGADTERAAEVLKAVYKPLSDGSYAKRQDAVAHSGPREAVPLICTSAKSAELIKHASNAFLAMKISFINSVSSVCEAVGAEISQVAEGIGTDKRIGPQFLNAGIGYGGSCFPKDLSAFRSIANEFGYEFRLLDEVIRVNEDQRRRFLKKVRGALWTVRGKKLAVLGLAFKNGTDDIRDSPAIAIVQMLVSEGADIVAYDPAAMARTREVLGDSIRYADSALAACEEADALLILTEWREFARLDLDKVHAALRYPIIIDGRNLYSPRLMAEKGFTYVSVGRQDVVANPKAIGV